MHKLTNAQQNELVVWEWFMPTSPTWARVPKKNYVDIQRFFEWSERGLHKKEADDFLRALVPKEKLTYFHSLIWGKRSAGVTIHELWEKDFYTSDWMGYRAMLGEYDGRRKWWNPMRFFKGDLYAKPIPRPVVDFIKKEMHKGIDAEIIEECYQSIL